MSLDQLINWRQIVTWHCKTTDSRPDHSASRKPGGRIKPAPVVRRLSQLSLLNHCLRKTDRVEIPKTRHERQQQPDAIALVNHQRLVTVSIVINNLFRRRVTNFKRIE